VGLNKNFKGNCGDLSGKSVEDLETKKSDFYGLNIEDSFISNSKVKISELVILEALLNEGTEIEKIKTPLNDLSVGHAKEYKSGQKFLHKYEKEYLKKKNTIKKLMDDYKIAKNEKEEKKIEEKLLKANNELKKLLSLIELISQKNGRHKNFSKIYGEFSED
jgi:hypothetical protein